MRGYWSLARLATRLPSVGHPPTLLRPTYPSGVLFVDMDAWNLPQSDFNQVEFERIDLAANARRYYLVAWQPNLYGEGTLIRMFGRMGRFKRVIETPFPSLEAASPMIQAIIRTRLRHGYHIL